MQGQPRASVEISDIRSLRRKRVSWRLEGRTKSQEYGRLISVPGWQAPQAILQVQVPKGPGYEWLVNMKVLRFAQDDTS